MNLVYSMTGFSVVTREWPEGTLVLEIRTVNHRYLEAQCRIPDQWRHLEPAMREQLSRHVKRGKTDCRLEWRTAQTASQFGTPDTVALERLRHASALVQEVFPDAAPLSVGDILRWHGVMAQDGSLPPSLEDDILAAMDEALQGLARTRAREGDKLRAFLLERVTQLQDIVLPLSGQVPALVAAFQEKLTRRLQEALGSAEEDRVRQEVVLFATRVDVEEELSRFKVHLEEIRHILNGGGSVGKRLDFLMQELHREANTLGSKSVSAPLSRASLDMKILIEQMREQIQNLE